MSLKMNIESSSPNIVIFPQPAEADMLARDRQRLCRLFDRILSHEDRLKVIAMAGILAEPEFGELTPPG